MVASGCFLAVAGDVVALVRDKTLFVLAAAHTERAIEFQLLSEPAVKDAVFKAEDPDDENPNNQQHAVTVNCITNVAFFAPSAGALALLVLVDERKLVHYDVDVAAGSVTYRSLRSLPRNAVCMGVAHLSVSGARQHVVIAGVKTGEAVAMPFPDINRDVKTLLGHTTSMIVHLAVNSTSSLLLTADRDEKIRVSGFPRTALIQSYCLGHTQSVTQVATSTVSPDLAVSTSLDNTIKLWAIATGALLDSTTLLPDELATSKALLPTSLAVSPVANVVAVVLNRQSVRLFAITAEQQLEALTLAQDAQRELNGAEPAHVQFLASGALAVAYTSAPFARVFRIATDAGAATVASESLVAESVWTRVRSTFASIEIAVADQVVDEFEDGLKKKKVRTAFDWKTKLATIGQPSSSAQ